MSNEEGLLASDGSVHVDPAQRVLAGLRGTPARQLRQRGMWAATGTCVVMALAFAGLYAHRMSDVLASPLTPVPWEVPSTGAPRPDATFFVDAMVWHPPKVMPTYVAMRTKPVALKPRRSRRAAPPDLDVAVLRVLVEHLDSQRKAGVTMGRTR